MVLKRRKMVYIIAQIFQRSTSSFPDSLLFKIKKNNKNRDFVKARKFSFWRNEHGPQRSWRYHMATPEKMISNASIIYSMYTKLIIFIKFRSPAFNRYKFYRSMWKNSENTSKLTWTCLQKSIFFHFPKYFFPELCIFLLLN